MPSFFSLILTVYFLIFKLILTLYFLFCIDIAGMLSFFSLILTVYFLSFYIDIDCMYFLFLYCPMIIVHSFIARRNSKMNKTSLTYSIFLSTLILNVHFLFCLDIDCTLSFLHWYCLYAVSPLSKKNLKTNNCTLSALLWYWLYTFFFALILTVHFLFCIDIACML